MKGQSKYLRLCFVVGFQAANLHQPTNRDLHVSSGEEQVRVILRNNALQLISDTRHAYSIDHVKNETMLLRCCISAVPAKTCEVFLHVLRHSNPIVETT